MESEVIGALLVDKPPGPTSHDVVGFARRLLATPRIGHTGTLDPLATGLLVLLVGEATRLSRFLVADDKEYIADVRLGTATATYDAQSLGPAAAAGGDAVPATPPSASELERVLERFRGRFLQTPPPFSAKKTAGVRAYEKARKNQPVELKAVEVTVDALEVLPAPSASTLRLRVVASSGFYVRSLAHDLGQAVGCGAHLEALRRTRAGRFRIEDAATLDQLQADPDPRGRLLPVGALLSHLPAVTLTDAGLRRAAHGNPLTPSHLTEAGCPLFSQKKGAVPFFRVLDADGGVRAVAEGRADGLLHPLVVLR